MKREKIYGFFFVLILLVSFGVRIIPPLNEDNFFFTMDQGNDAVHVREILERGKLQLLGPETGIKGLFALPLWFYFIAMGYFLFGGHPFGGVFMVILLNVLLTGVIMWKIAKKLSFTHALIIGTMLLTSWWFYNTSRYAFNPFPLVFISFIQLFLLCDFLEGKGKMYIFAGAATALAFHFEVAGAIALSIFYFSVGILSILRRKLPWKTFFSGLMLFSLFLTPYFVSELTSNFDQTHTFIKEYKNPRGVFSESRVTKVTSHFVIVASRAVLRQYPELGFLLFVVTSVIFYKQLRKRKVEAFTKNFVSLSIGLFIISLVWFSSNKGWYDWQTIYLSPLIFVSGILMFLELPKKISVLFFLLSIVSHLQLFDMRYKEYFYPSDDPSLLKNELAAVSWVYDKAEGKDFSVYSYLPSVLDYPYQYLFWWQGKRKYDYLPCEYSTYPNSIKSYVPGYKYYEDPKRQCSNLVFLVIEPDKNEYLQNIWFKGVSESTSLVEEGKAGKIVLQKRLKF